MAPEQLTGEVTVATDVYGLGAVLYQLLTTRPPSTAATLTRVLEEVQVAAPIPPIQLNSRVDPDLNAICLKCLAREPANRYATAAEVAADLVRFRLGHPPHARPCGLLGRVARLIRDARALTDLKSLALGLFAQSAFVLTNNSIAFALLQAGAAEGWVWMAVFASYVPLFVLLTRDRLTMTEQYSPAKFHLWTIWAGHITACSAVFVACRLAAGAGGARAIETGYIGCAGINALAFVVMGSLFAGRQYLLGLAWAGAAVVMGLFLPYAPLVYAVLIAICSLITGFQLQSLQLDQDPPTTGTERSARDTS